MRRINWQPPLGQVCPKTWRLQLCGHALASAELFTLEQFHSVTEPELIAIHGIGPRAVQTIQMAIARQGWELNV